MPVERMARVCTADVSSARVIVASTRVDAAVSMSTMALTGTPAASAIVRAMLRRSIDVYDVGEPERVKIVLTVASLAASVAVVGGGDSGSGGIG